jgi:very-short-patch-repair endonuclease
MLRKKATDTKRTLWRHLRNRNFAGYKFRHQHPLGCYIIDFYSPKAKLAIELDGGGHNYQLRRIRDRRRSNVLADHGVTLLRFWNHQVRYELDSVLKAIWFALEQRAIPPTLTSILALAKGEADFEPQRCEG